MAQHHFRHGQPSLSDDGLIITHRAGAVKAFNAAKWMAIIGGIVMIGGFAINLPGETKIKQAIDNYNSALTYRPTLHIGGTQNGIGIAYVF